MGPTRHRLARVRQGPATLWTTWFHGSLSLWCAGVSAERAAAAQPAVTQLP